MSAHARIDGVRGTGPEQRVLILARSGREAELLVRAVGAEGLEAISCSSMARLCAALDAGAALVIVTQEDLSKELQPFERCLAHQPEWSQLPVLLLTGPQVSGRDLACIERLCSSFNITLLERPSRRSTLVSAVRSALLARRRQYALRDRSIELAGMKEALQESRALLESKATALEQSDRHKDELMARLAHELRNPLVAVGAAGRLLMDRWRSDDQELTRAVQLIADQSQQLTRLIDDLLDLARISRGQIVLRREPCRLEDIVARSVAAARPLMDEKGQSLRVTPAPSALWLRADPARLSQVLVNLLVNAARRTPSGSSIELEVRSEPGAVELRVRATGAGFGGELMARLFEPFSQGARGSDRAAGGLGLLLAEQLTELHGGQLRARDRSDGGAEVVVRLPLTELAGATPHERQTGASPHSLRRRRVLVVDDDTGAAGLLEILFRDRGHDVRVASDGKQALERALEFKPDLALLDIGLPDMSGFELCAELRRLTARDELEIVALSGYGDEQARQEASQAGFDRYMVKGASINAVEQLLAELGL